MRCRPLAAAVLCAVQVAGCGSSVTPRATDATASPSVSPPAWSKAAPVGTIEASASPTSATSYAVPAGAFVIADVERSGDGFLAVLRTVADADSGVTSTQAVPFDLPDRWTVDRDHLDVRLSDDGYVAIGLRAHNEDDVGRAVAVIQVSAADADVAVVVEGAGPTWLGDPDDTLLTVAGDDTGHDVVHLWPDHGTSDGPDLTTPDFVFLASHGGHPVVNLARDGVWTARDDDGDPAQHRTEALRFGGTVEPRGPGELPVFVTGLERDRLLEGSTTIQWCDDGLTRSECGTTLVRPDGGEVRLLVPDEGNLTGDIGVDRSGTRLIALSSGRLLVYAARDGEPVVERSQRLPDAESLEWNEIVGISEDVVALARFGELLLVAPGGTSDPIPGVLAYIGR